MAYFIYCVTTTYIFRHLFVKRRFRVSLQEIDTDGVLYTIHYKEHTLRTGRSTKSEIKPFSCSCHLYTMYKDATTVFYFLCVTQYIQSFDENSNT